MRVTGGTKEDIARRIDGYLPVEIKVQEPEGGCREKSVLVEELKQKKISELKTIARGLHISQSN